MNSVFLSLGGNIGNREDNIKKTVSIINKKIGKVIRQSSLYIAEPWGHYSKNYYLNAVIEVNTQFSALVLIKKIAAVEHEMGRVRKKERYVDRTMDIDILYFNSDVINLPTLQIPHPRLYLRNFVLKPICDIAPNKVHPIFKLTQKKLLLNSKDKAKVSLYKAPKYICVEGNIGSGKSTLAKALAKELNALYLPELFETNKILPLFYNNQKKFALATEYFFLNSRFHQILNALENENKIIVADFSIYKCLWFAKANLTKINYALFKTQAINLIEALPKPDLIVYLKTSIKNLEKNIYRRGREMEKNIDKNYLQKVSNEYDAGISNLKNIPIIKLLNTHYSNALTNNNIKKIKKNYLNKA
ncbi:MAG: 2-amino-4-hydroxy-6-hydroxymethyldihydropteridine diphosphokinase [Bacteroidetes bacterium]|nr:2-amino-4-hydroxy-6-hydroxymethyldihydropteridine diphosphokinase [Bacteroidota bacterium]